MHPEAGGLGALLTGVEYCLYAPLSRQASLAPQRPKMGSYSCAHPSLLLTRFYGPEYGAVGNDEELFAGLDEPQFTTRKFHNRRPVVAQSLCPSSEPPVLVLQSGDRVSQLLMRPPDIDGLNKSSIADQRVRDEDCCRQPQQGQRHASTQRWGVVRGPYLSGAGAFRRGQR